MEPGEWVRIKSPDEIRSTLTDKGRNRGLWFDREMLRLCGQVFRVRHRVGRLIDDRTGEMIELSSDCVALEGATCSGEHSVGRWFCVRAIYPYWREAWLERVESETVVGLRTAKPSRNRRLSDAEADHGCPDPCRGARVGRVTFVVGVVRRDSALARRGTEQCVDIDVDVDVDNWFPDDSLPGLPAGWPDGLELGVSDAPGGASAMSKALGFRYQYLSGGVNTGNGWATWTPGGDFVTNYVAESRAAQIVPVFSYYQLFQSNPGVSMGESGGVYANLTNPSTMAAYYDDLELFFQKAGAAGGMTVLHVEPDLWAYLQQRASGDDATTVPAQVGSSGQSEVAGLPDNVAGFAQAIVRLRDRYAPNVLLGYHFSTWATGTDIVYADPPDGTVTDLGMRTARFEQSLGARFDVAFTDLADRDADSSSTSTATAGRRGTTRMTTGVRRCSSMLSPEPPGYASCSGSCRWATRRCAPRTTRGTTTRTTRWSGCSMILREPT